RIVVAMEECVQEATILFDQQQGVPQYLPIPHKGQPERYPAYTMHIPHGFLNWRTDRRDVIAFPTQDVARSILNFCRCGVVRGGIFFTRNDTDGDEADNARYMVAVKMMDRHQLQLQRDDIENELSVMRVLQPGGFTGVLHNPHILQWEASSDVANEYIATDYVSNGSLVLYSHHRLQELRFHVSIELAHHPELQEARLAQLWTHESLHLFHGIMKGLAYIHAQDVAHLDLDPNNIVIDDNRTPRILDFGSGEYLRTTKGPGFAGGGTSLVKCKPLYAPPEVRRHNQSQPPRTPFNGTAADMWSAGTMLYQLVCFGYPAGEYALVRDVNWRRNLLAHANDIPHAGNECYICVREIAFPPVVYEIFRSLLNENDPDARMSAFAVAELLGQYLTQIT
ncbi:serine/threonine protein kinase, partial [Aphanomyces invadans]